jgi:uncharacterized protein YaaQ
MRARFAGDGISTQIASLGIPQEIALSENAPAITKSDEAFLKDGVEFMWGIKDLDVDELNDLFEKVCSRSNFGSRSCPTVEMTSHECTHFLCR